MYTILLINGKKRQVQHVNTPADVVKAKGELKKRVEGSYRVYLGNWNWKASAIQWEQQFMLNSLCSL